MEAPLRIALSLVGLASMTLAGWLWMRSGRVDLGLMPVPVVPMYAGYDVAAVVRGMIAGNGGKAAQ